MVAEAAFSWPASDGDAYSSPSARQRRKAAREAAQHRLVVAARAAAERANLAEARCKALQAELSLARTNETSPDADSSIVTFLGQLSVQALRAHDMILRKFQLTGPAMRSFGTALGVSEVRKFLKRGSSSWGQPS